MSTTTLIRDLEQIGIDFPETRGLEIFDKLTKDAKDGIFHDSNGDEDVPRVMMCGRILAAPKLILYGRIQEVAAAVSGRECEKTFTELASKVFTGAYDDEFSEEQQVEMANLVARHMPSRDLVQSLAQSNKEFEETQMRFSYPPRKTDDDHQENP